MERIGGSGGAGGRSRGDGAERRVVVGRRHVPVEIDELADVFRQIDGREIEGVAEDVDRERARRRIFEAHGTIQATTLYILKISFDAH